MKNRYTSAMLLCFALFLLAACDIKIRSTVNLSDIFSKTSTVAMSDLLINVSSCSESDIQQAIGRVAKNDMKAKYKSCKNEDMDSYAVFSMPLVIVKNDNEEQNKGDFYLSTKDDKLYIHTSGRMSDLLATGDGTLDIGEVSFELVNDTQENVKINVQSVFIDGQAVLARTMDIAPYESVGIRLSDVTRKILERPNVALPIVKFVR